MITKYVEGYVARNGRDGSVVQRSLSGRQVLTKVVTPLYKRNTYQQEARTTNRVLIGSWDQLTEIEKQTWRDVVTRLEYPYTSGGIWPSTANNLFYQINNLKRTFNEEIVLSAPNCGYNNETGYLYFDDNLLPERIVIKIEANDGAKSNWMRIAMTTSNKFHSLSSDKKFRLMGYYEFSRLRTIDLTEVYASVFGPLTNRYSYIVAEVQPWNSNTMERGNINVWTGIIKK